MAADQISKEDILRRIEQWAASEISYECGFPSEEARVRKELAEVIEWINLYAEIVTCSDCRKFMRLADAAFGLNCKGEIRYFADSNVGDTILCQACGVKHLAVLSPSPSHSS